MAESGASRLYNMELRVRADAHFIRMHEGEVRRNGGVEDRRSLDRADLYDAMGDIFEAMQLSPDRFRKLIIEVRSHAAAAIVARDAASVEAPDE